VTGAPPRLRTLHAADLGPMADLHRSAFPDSVLSALGSETLRRYYRWQIDGPHQVEPIGAFLDDELVGFLVGGRFHGSMIGFVKGQAAFLVVQVMRHPAVVRGGRGRRAIATGLRLLVRPAGRTTPERPDRVPDGSFGVLAIAVAPHHRRLGIGSALFAEAERRARATGMHRLHLTLDPSNPGAVAFYEGQGWRRLGLPGDTDHQWLMGKTLSPEPGAAFGEDPGPRS